MKYYEMHDNVYKKLHKKNIIGWNGEKDVKDIFFSDINTAIKEELSRFFPISKEKNVLDLGTGTGNSALFMAKEGFNVTGYDLSPKAIELAIENAKKLDLKVDFCVKNIAESDFIKNYDLVIDSSFLHCIVYNSERKHIFNSIKKVLKNDAYLFIHTMIQSDDMSEILSRDSFILKDDVLWSKAYDDCDMDMLTIDGKKVFPHRRILSLENFEKEILEHGFIIKHKKILENERIPKTYIAWLQLKS